MSIFAKIRNSTPNINIKVLHFAKCVVKETFRSRHDYKDSEGALTGTIFFSILLSRELCAELFQGCNV